MNILFASNNDNKKEIYEMGFKILNTEAKCIDLEEAGLKGKFKYEISNANLDAIEFSKSCDLLTVTVQESIHIEGIPEEKQPSKSFLTYYMEKGQLLEDKMKTNEKIREYYLDIINKLGGKAKAKLIDKVTIAKNGKVLKSFNIENETVLTSKISKNLNHKNPLYSMMLIPEFGDIHYSDCNIEELKFLYEIKNKKTLEEISMAIKTLNC